MTAFISKLYKKDEQNDNHLSEEGLAKKTFPSFLHFASPILFIHSYHSALIGVCSCPIFFQTTSQVHCSLLPQYRITSGK